MPADPSAAIEGVQQALDEWKVKVDAQVQEDIRARTRPVRWIGGVVALLVVILLAGGAAISYVFVDLSNTQTAATDAYTKSVTDSCIRGNQLRDGIRMFITILASNVEQSPQVSTLLGDANTIFADQDCARIEQQAKP